MPYALCPMPYALCPVVPHLSEKGYSSVYLRYCTILNYLFRNRLFGLFHKKTHFLWNGPENPFLTMVQHLRFILFIQLTICSSCLNLEIDTKSNNGQKPVRALDKH